MTDFCKKLRDKELALYNDVCEWTPFKVNTRSIRELFENKICVEYCEKYYDDEYVGDDESRPRSLEEKLTFNNWFEYVHDTNDGEYPDADAFYRKLSDNNHYDEVFITDDELVNNFKVCK